MTTRSDADSGRIAIWAVCIIGVLITAMIARGEHMFEILLVWGVLFLGLNLVYLRSLRCPNCGARFGALTARAYAARHLYMSKHCWNCGADMDAVEARQGPFDPALQAQTPATPGAPDTDQKDSPDSP
ncbi:MAG: hypothetical protein AB7N54_04780 [Alphaproteobacteria bacterium]